MKLRQTDTREYNLTEELVFDVFSQTSFSEGKIEKKLVKEIRSSEYYIPKLDFVVEKKNTLIAHCMLSRFPLNQKHTNELLLLAPVCVSPDYQQQGVGKMMVTKAIGIATVMGFKGVIVEGDPNYYHRFGFKTSTEFGIYASSKILPPSPRIYKFFTVFTLFIYFKGCYYNK
ncbi:hypothetical protein GCM10008932_14020 [Alkalibacterium iburiense]|uniref:N-acetyltransferase domain-containing protein n=1 Tax=Alkalibacterium iburiense TaxID=290589 RepID=A0ABN0XFA8_9LACT